MTGLSDSNQRKRSLFERSSSARCPCCKGRKGHWQHLEPPDFPPWCHTPDPEVCECGAKFVPCFACNGAGESDAAVAQGRF